MILFYITLAVRYKEQSKQKSSDYYLSFWFFYIT